MMVAVRLWPKRTSPVEKRRVEWMSSVGERLDRLEANGLSLEGLKSNDQFVSAAMHAAQIALRTHNSEKLHALRNAISNVALGLNADENQQSLFLHWIDIFSPLHLRILKFFQQPPTSHNISAGSLAHVLTQHLPDLRDQNELVKQVWRDLYLSGLTTTDTLHGMMSGEGLKAKRTSDLGDSFISFIQDPISAP